LLLIARAARVYFPICGEGRADGVTAFFVCELGLAISGSFIPDVLTGSIYPEGYFDGSPELPPGLIALTSLLSISLLCMI
jgi:hypothetical protein